MKSRSRCAESGGWTRPEEAQRLLRERAVEDVAAEHRRSAVVRRKEYLTTLDPQHDRIRLGLQLATVHMVAFDLRRVGGVTPPQTLFRLDQDLHLAVPDAVRHPERRRCSSRSSGRRPSRRARRTAGFPTAASGRCRRARRPSRRSRARPQHAPAQRGALRTPKRVRRSRSDGRREVCEVRFVGATEQMHGHSFHAHAADGDAAATA